MGTFRIDDLVVTLLPGDAKCGAPFLPDTICGGHHSLCLKTAQKILPNGQVQDLGVDELAELKQRLQDALERVDERENALQKRADARGTTMERAELDAMEEQLTAALDELRKRRDSLP
jgi:hypothetical protein